MGQDNSGKPLMHLFMHIGKLLNERLRSSLSEEGIHFGQARILVALLHHKKLSQGVIGRGLDIKPATVTNLVKKMEASGLVDRKRDMNDDRLINVTLTAKGKKAAAFSVTVMEKIENDICSEIEQQEIEDLRSPLERIRNRFGGFDPTL